MFEQDYLMRILLQYAEILRRSWFKANHEKDPRGAAEMLEASIGEATDIDGATLLSLAPESMGAILQVSGVDERVVEYITRSLALASEYLREDGQHLLADLRLEQARSLANTYGFYLPENLEELAQWAEEQFDQDASEKPIIDIATLKEDEKEALVRSIDEENNQL
ncbi:hypothetical protein [Adlercreutzia agrestimuris]|uniref:hypothetical protein n=1 Tax=Adlercreutzia agrestimuris TaxID=2941324 RepID=UPI002041075D|nr:hypothetical protein [Adlercreutzia agrestimuris]